MKNNILLIVELNLINMCVIIYKPKGVELPSLDLLTKANAFNPHGFGLCSPTQFYKGFNGRKLVNILGRCSIDEPVFIHFRYATTGSVKVSNCHPFYDEKTNTYFMHNGVLPYRPEDDITDSEFIFNVLKPYINTKKFKPMVNKVIGSSKFAFMLDDIVTLYGDFIEHNGLFLSNSRFL